MVYKSCVVPQCTSTTISTPEKLFLFVPCDPKKRRKWFELARRIPTTISANSTVFMCEDHFDIEKDIANYMQYKMGFSQKILVAEGALPLKFNCQKDRKRRLRRSCTSRGKFLKKQEMNIIKECEKKLQLTEEHIAEVCKSVQGNSRVMEKSNGVGTKILPETKDKLKITSSIVTSDKSFQTALKGHYRNKGVQTRFSGKNSFKMTDVSTTEMKNNINVEVNHVPINVVQEQEIQRECRACLQKFEVDSFLFDLFQAWTSPWHGMKSTIAEDLAKLANVQISTTDRYSKVICQVCYQRLQDACHFTATVQGSDRIFRQAGKQQKNDTDLEKTWPEPIQVAKNIDRNIYGNAMEVDIKQEVMSDEDYELDISDEGYRETNLASLDIKIEPEEFTESRPTEIAVTKIFSFNHHEQNSVMTNGKNFYDEDNYPEHEVKQEPQSEEEVDAEPDLPLECMLCMKSLNSVTGLKAHVIAQHSYKTVRRKTSYLRSPEKKYKDKYVCATCQRSFTTSTDLMVHETCHNKDVCYGCNEKFDTFDELSSHRKRCKALINKVVQKPKTLEDVKRPQIEEPKAIENMQALAEPETDLQIKKESGDNSMKIHLEIHSIKTEDTDSIDCISKEIKVETLENVLTEDKVTP